MVAYFQQLKVTNRQLTTFFLHFALTSAIVEVCMARSKRQTTGAKKSKSASREPAAKSSGMLVAVAVVAILGTGAVAAWLLPKWSAKSSATAKPTAAAVSTPP